MKLSELMGHITSLGENAPNSVYGVEVDSFLPDVCTSLKEIGLIAREDSEAPGQLDLDVLDTILSYTSHGISGMLEVPYDSNLDPAMMISISMNCGVTLSLLPPEGNNDEGWVGYSESLKKYAALWLDQANAKHQLQPVSGYIEYMVQAEFGYERDTLTDDRYMAKAFVENQSVNRIDWLKSELEPVILEKFGGRESFSQFAHSVAAAIGRHGQKLVNK
jgi:hypothetical protein